MKNNRYLTIPELARILGISRIAVYKKVKNGTIKAIRVGRNFAISRASIDRINNGNTNKRTEKNRQGHQLWRYVWNVRFQIIQ